MLQGREDAAVAEAEAMADKVRAEQQARAALERGRAAFLAGLIEGGNARLTEMLNPSFLNVASSQEAFAAQVRALGVLEQEAFHEDYVPGLMHFDPLPRTDRTSARQERKILSYAEWSTDTPVNVGRTHQYFGGLLGTTPRSHTSFSTKHIVVPTEEGLRVVDQYRASVNLPSVQEQKERNAEASRRAHEESAGILSRLMIKSYGERIRRQQ